MTPIDRAATYFKFLNLLNAVRDLSSFPSLDALEERLLNTLAATWHTNRRITVVEAMNILPDTSTATVYRRLTTLRKKGLLEIQLDEHKLLILYGHELVDFEDILDDYGLPCCEDIKFITEAEHVHSSTDDFVRQFDQMKYRLGIDED